MTSDKKRFTFLKSSQSHIKHLTAQGGSQGREFVRFICEGLNRGLLFISFRNDRMKNTV